MTMYATESMAPDRLLAGANDNYAAQEIVTIAAPGALARGSVLGKVTKGAITGADGEGNTGNAAIGDEARGAGAKVGTYAIEITELLGTKVKGTATKVGSGNGTITFTSITQDAKVGNYVATCITAVGDGGVFLLRDPDGADVGTITVGTPFDNGLIAVTIADGSTDWSVGETVTFPVAWDSDTSRFSVVDPDGIRLADGFIGTAYEGDIEFEIAEGDTHSALGDTFAVTIAAGAGGYKLVNSTNVDGSQEPVCILAETIEASDSAVTTAAYFLGEFNENALVFGGEDDADTHREALQAKGIFLRSAVAT